MTVTGAAGLNALTSTATGNVDVSDSSRDHLENDLRPAAPAWPG